MLPVSIAMGTWQLGECLEELDRVGGPVSGVSQILTELAISLRGNNEGDNDKGSRLSYFLVSLGSVESTFSVPGVLCGRRYTALSPLRRLMMQQPPIMLETVAVFWCPGCGKEQVVLV